MHLDLPIGRVARLDVRDDADLVSMYLWSSGGQLHQLVCRGPENAVTSWDAIVSSAEPHGR
jgi:hypothetical protein